MCLYVSVCLCVCAFVCVCVCARTHVCVCPSLALSRDLPLSVSLSLLVRLLVSLSHIRTRLSHVRALVDEEASLYTSFTPHTVVMSGL